MACSRLFGASRTLCLAAGIAGMAASVSCSKNVVVMSNGGDESDGGSSVTTQASTTQSVEWVAYHTEVPYAATDFHALASGLFGSDAQSGKLISNKEISTGIFLDAVADPTTPDQTRVTFSYDDGTATHRPLAMAPASFSVGSIFLTSIDAALAQMQADVASNNAAGEEFLLQYQVTSAMGGTFSFGVHGKSGVYTLVLDVSTPTTSLATATIGQAATNAAPYDSIAGTVWFSMTKDDFDFFVGHAYGADATAGQNFKDFALVPFTWLRLTVDPHLDQQFVNVSFDVLGTDGTRTPLANAPASILAGNTFQTMVDRNMASMLSQEAAKQGSSTPWQVPFFYNAPINGGVVQVIAQGALGQFTVAYAVQSPRHTLTDVPFVAYKPVAITTTPVAAACNQSGNAGIVADSQGVFAITFTASTEVTQSPSLKGPLKGQIQCSVYKAADVTVEGPNANAVSLQDFNIDNADLTPGAPAPQFTTAIFPDGSYQILCGQDINGDGQVGMGDPVTLPIGGFPIACNINPVTVQFAILDPQN
jgi:hypothetical protein